MNSTPTTPRRQDAKTTTEHTPGPWKIAGSCHVKESPDGLFFHVAHIAVFDDYAPNPLIAEVGNRGRFCSEVGAHSPGPEQKANSRLIAAAPDLLAACQRAVAAAEKSDDFIEGHCAFEALKAAIAKATQP